MFGRFAMMMGGALVVIGGSLVMLAATVATACAYCSYFVWCDDGEEIVNEV